MHKLGGLYLVVPATLTFDKLLVCVDKALKGGVDILQLIVENDAPKTLTLARNLAYLTRKHEAPFLINGSVPIAEKVEADGMHFDSYDFQPTEIRKTLGNKSIVGYRVSNDLERLSWAENVKADYVSFCSVFPSSRSAQCPLVTIETLKTARSRTSLPIFAAGGINSSNASIVMEAGVDGIAVTSAILEARDPEQEARVLQNIIHRYRKKAQ